MRVTKSMKSALTKSEADLINENLTKHQRLFKQIGKWASFYRANPHRFAKDYLNLTLKLFQQLVLNMMFASDFFMAIMSRGCGKTFMVSIFCLIRCILYPGTKIVIASGNRGQASQVLEKIDKEIFPDAPLARAELKYYKNSLNQVEMVFKNGSYIKVVTANDGARSARANILVNSFA